MNSLVLFAFDRILGGPPNPIALATGARTGGMEVSFGVILDNAAAEASANTAASALSAPPGETKKGRSRGTGPLPLVVAAASRRECYGGGGFGQSSVFW